MKKIIASFLLIATVTAASAQVSVTQLPNDNQISIVNNTSCALLIKMGYDEETAKVIKGELAVGKDTKASLAEFKTKTGLKVFYYPVVEGCTPISSIPVDPQILPIKFRSVTSKWIDSRTLLVTFDVAEVSGVNVYKVRVSRDGVNYTEKAVVFPETTKADHIYTTKIRF